MSHDPVARFRAWYAAAERAGNPDVQTVALATADRRGRASVRYVYLKAVDARGFVFGTKSTSRKHRELRENAWCAMAFYWPETGKQVRVEGPVEEVSRAEARALWMERPRLSRLAGLASTQSRPLESRAALRKRFRALVREFEGRDVPCPGSWVGWRVRPRRIEFWTRGEHRLHHRERFERRGRAWVRVLLNP